jgi:putative oxidoreductase
MGATVTWVWRDGAIAHDVKGDGFKSKVTAKGTFRRRFDQPRHLQVCLHPAPQHDRHNRGERLMLKPTPTPAAGRRLEGLLGRAVPLLLRGSLGLTFVWFGALKLAGQPTLPASLIAAITPFVDPDLSVPLVGAFEVALGIGLLVGRFLPVVLAGVALQLASTFLVLLRPDVASVDGNPLLLSVEGEYVVKNLVLLAATAALALHTLSPRPDGTTTRQFPDAHDPDHRPPTRHAA